MLKQRIITALIALGVLLVVMFVLPADAAKAFIGLLVLGGAWEWTNFLKPDSPLIRFAYMGLIAVLVLISGLLLPVAALPVLSAAIVWWVIALVWTFYFPTPIPMALRWLCGIFILIPLFVALASLYTAGPLYLRRPRPTVQVGTRPPRRCRRVPRRA